MSAAAAVPTHDLPLVRLLGYGGLIPFVAGAALVWLLPAAAQPLGAAALSAYAAAIVSFLGGVHWGIGLRDGTPKLFVWGVLPPLAAALALLLPPRHALWVHAALLLLCYAVDRRVYPAHGLQGWLKLRARLSAVAAASCLLAAAAAPG